MLNTKQSNQRKSWKYALILPVLSAFMLLFQVETVAQVKEQKNEETNFEVTSSYSSVLTKNSSDKEIKELEKTFSDENQKLKITNVKRNKNGEIIEIKLSFDTGKTYNQILERKSKEPIDNIKIFIDTDVNDNVTCGFIEVDNKAVTAIVSSDSETIEVNGFVKEKSNNFWSMDNMTKNGKEVVLIINGKIKGATEKVKIPLNEELGDMIELTPSEFEKKYHKKSDPNKYYYEVETVKTKITGVSWDDAKKISESKISENKNRLYIINGKEYLQSEIPKGTTVEVDGSISELSKEEGIKKYGQKAKDGVLIFNGKSTFVKKNENEVPKNLKINFEKGKTYIIEGHKANYEELKDKKLFIYTGSKYSITEKNNVVTINGDIVEDAEMWNVIEVTDSNPKKVSEAKYLNFNTGEKIVYYNKTLKIPGQPAISVKDYKISIDDTEISEKDFLNLIDMRFNRFVYFEKSKVLKFYTK